MSASITIRTRYYGGAYIATSGKTRASSTNSAKVAAEACALKCFPVGEVVVEEVRVDNPTFNVATWTARPRVSSSEGSTVFDLADGARGAAMDLTSRARALFAMEEAQRKVREELESAIRCIYASTLCAKDSAVTDHLRKLTARLERLRELSNTQELGAFPIQCQRAAEAVWKCLE